MQQTAENIEFLEDCPENARTGPSLKRASMAQRVVPARPNVCHDCATGQGRLIAPKAKAPSLMAWGFLGGTKIYQSNA